MTAGVPVSEQESSCVGWIRKHPTFLVSCNVRQCGMFLKREARTATQSQSPSLIHKGWGAQTKGVEHYASQDSDCVCPLAASGRAVRLHEGQPLRHENDRSCALPADAGPLGFGAGMEESCAAATLGKLCNPTSRPCSGRRAD